ncbi:polysaccharide deacetylase family protein [Aureispira anguillae]|uniref:Polysaccharide deacetylase family protein n=1 Tax=Aureispira anguillae TaxID=2864201 RepID=A0A916DXD4_9BACT|nr:polysaccharide deacetylase family protein [Aureispira anguillae]BDS15640.1 polysaccharide deacetylase family protein [Aureispira anguillae]
MGPFPKYIRFNTVLFTTILLLVLAALQGLAWWVYAVIIAISSVIAYFGTTQISSNFHLPAYCRAYEPKKKEIAITFDDGVTNPVQSHKVLDILKHYNIPATFFCIGKNLSNEAQIDVLKRMDKEGHLIGNHSYSHSNFFDFFSSKRIIQELQETDAIIQQHIGKTPLFFRPPYGITNPNIAKALRQLDHKTIGWSLRSLDTVIKDQTVLLKRVKSKLQKGDVILLHDHLEHLPDFLPLFLEYLLKEGYEVVGIDQLLQLKPYQ